MTACSRAVWGVLLLTLLPAALSYNLVLIHTNDVHAHIEEMNKYASSCKDSDREKGGCYGGVARRVTKVNEIRDQDPDHTLLLDAGDQFQGTLWFNIYKGQEAARFMNEMKYDAMSLGNHEFDNGVDGLIPFMRNVTFPIVCCNLDTTHQTNMQGLCNSSIILNKGGKRIGIIGYLTEETAFISNPGNNLQFKDVVDSVKAEVQRIKSKVDILIGVGHYGYGNDIKLANAVPELDIIVGGHTHTFLYNMTGPYPSIDTPEGPYPTIVDHGSRKTLVVQSYFAAKYFGFLNITFDSSNNVESWKGQPILLDNSTLQDLDILAEVTEMGKRLEEKKLQVVGFSAVYLEGDSKVCRLMECNLGNLITDAMIAFHTQKPTNGSWGDAAIAILNSGGIRAPIEKGNISQGDVLTTMPFGNNVDLINLQGRYLRQALEHAVSKYDKLNRAGAFLQVSGLRITYDLCRPPGQRVVSAYTRCRKCSYPRYSPLDDDKIYTIATIDFVIRGQDGFVVIRDHHTDHKRFNNIDSDVFTQYLQSNSPIFKGEEGRITLLEDCTSNAGQIIKPNALILCFLFVFLFCALLR
uniref:5'-nucleotidase n=1 Tax=Crassostrea virginica TaxID=6565 RepID=A0A8B8AJJ6_CRAVI|nr:5'-nucleotidase-like [Crassostrea virginica]